MPRFEFRRFTLLVASFCLLASTTMSSLAEEVSVSFEKDVLPIFREHCMGCHQPASQSGGYMMTSQDKLVLGGESGERAIVPGDASSSALARLVTPHDGMAEMPKNSPPLSVQHRDIIQRWISQGAQFDGSTSRPTYNAEHPPKYSRAPVVSAIDFSPDGQLLAVSGHHEVLLFEADRMTLRHRLIGMSPRIESLKFSHDGKRLAVTAGEPSSSGELQVWDIANGSLLLSKFVGSDTLFGIDWSPDDQLLSFACTDNTIRCVRSDSGEQVLFQGAHDDWPRATSFSVSGEHILSAGRDMTVKLTEVATQRFIDNVTSITPGALRGGINALARHPYRDEIFVGSSDGVPKLYRVFRQTARQIGDDANLIRQLPAMPGRIFDVRISSDASILAAVSTLDQVSHVRVWKYETADNVPENIRQIQSKNVADRTTEERTMLDAYSSAEPMEIARWELPSTAAYALAISQNRTIAVGSADGTIRVWKIDDSSLLHEVSAITDNMLAGSEKRDSLQQQRAAYLARAVPTSPAGHLEKDQASIPEHIVSIRVSPAKVNLENWKHYTQLLVTAELADGSEIDVTRHATVEAKGRSVLVHEDGFVEPLHEGEGELKVSIGDHAASVPTRVGATAIDEVDFVRDVNPVLSRMGCNQGTCHGSQAGKNGFKLSLRGYDPIFDIRSLTDDLAARRINFSSPNDSLILSKPLGTAPHAGGVLMHSGDLYSTIVEQWILQGANLATDSKRAVKIDVMPSNPVVDQAGNSQQVRVVATYEDGTERDVTREAFIESGNSEVAQVNRTGLATAIRRGEAPLLARYEGNYAATTLTVMGERDGFEWSSVETWTPIDALVAEKWQRMKIRPSELCSDADFIRRVYLDLTGLPPSAHQVREFIKDATPTRVKRDALIDQLVGSPNYLEHMTNKWADLLQVNSKFLGKEGATSFRNWIAEEVKKNTPYDQFVKNILVASGSNRENPAASYYKILRTPEEIMENTTHLFLALRFNCNKCHDHPFERWTQDQYYETAAFFSKVDLKKDEASGDRMIGGSAVEGAKPLYEEVYDKAEGSVIHQRTGKAIEPKHPFSCEFENEESLGQRAEMAAWLTSQDNPYFARSYVNRLWGYLLGVALIEPIDDIRAGNPASIPAVLDHLEQEFIASGFDVQSVVKQICKSRVYQLDSGTNEWNQDDQTNYSHAIARRLPSEVLYDAVHFVTGTETTIPGVDKGTRAAALPDADSGLADGFLNNLGRPARESACECERSNDLQLGAVMALLSGPTVGNAISEKNNALHQIVAQLTENEQLIDELYLRVLNRPASDAEIAGCKPFFEQVATDHMSLQAALQEVETWWAAEREIREATRVKNLAEARQRLVAREMEIAEARTIAETERLAQETAATTAAEQYLAGWQSDLDSWFSARKSTVRWDLLAPMDVSSSNGVELRPQPDRSILAVGNKDKGVYNITTASALSSVRQIRLEALTDPSLAAKGPGFPFNGNFVVTEFELFAGPASDPNAWTKIKLREGKSDFDQAGFSAAAAIDDKTNDQGGWAVANAGGVEHWAVFALEQPLQLPDDWVLQVRIHQNHDAAEHRLGRFRLSVSNSEEFVVGLPESFSTIQRTPNTLRSESSRELLTAYFMKTDAEYMRLQQVVAEAKKPLPEDEQSVAIKLSIQRLEAPIADDLKVVQMRSDFEQSKQQLEQSRITAAEDITWALINSPAFLFNH